MRIGDLVTISSDIEAEAAPGDGYGIIVDFRVVYDRYGEPQEKFVVVNWGEDFPNEDEYMHDIRVISESR